MPDAVMFVAWRNPRHVPKRYRKLLTAENGWIIMQEYDTEDAGLDGQTGYWYTVASLEVTTGKEAA